MASDDSRAWDWEENLIWDDNAPPVKVETGMKRKTASDEEETVQKTNKRIKTEAFEEEDIDKIARCSAAQPLADPILRMTTNIAFPGYCCYFSDGRTCQKGSTCAFIHDQGVRDQALWEKKMNGGRLMSLAERVKFFEPEFAIIVSGYDDWNNRHRNMVQKRFQQHDALCFEWSSIFEAAVRQQLTEKYSLPDQFVRIIFSNPENQRAAIIKWNGKQLGFKGPRLLVQGYRSIGPTTPMYRGITSAPERASSGAEQFEQAKQSEDEDGNKEMGNIIRPESELVGASPYDETICQEHGPFDSVLESVSIWGQQWVV